MPPFEPPSSSQSSRTNSIQSDGFVQSRHLRPEDAYSPPNVQVRARSPLGRSDTVTAATAGLGVRDARKKRRNRSSTRHRPRPWKKLLWVKQSYPDNYTDEETFLDHLQRNPRLQPYEFWTLMADSTIIVQHVCSVIIFVSCFTAIFQERVGPVSVVGWATGGTVAGWVLRDWWRWREEGEEVRGDVDVVGEEGTPESVDAGLAPRDMTMPVGMGTVPPSRAHSRNASLSSVAGVANSPPLPLGEEGAGSVPSPTYITPYNAKPSMLSPRMAERLTTAKSAILIYFSLLGLSPILKSLTWSTSSDSIWALSSWLMCTNVFTFDYGAGPEAKYVLHQNNISYIAQQC